MGRCGIGDGSCRGGRRLGVVPQLLNCLLDAAAK